MKEFVVEGKKFLRFDNLNNAGVFHFTSTKVGWKNNGNTRFTGDSPEIYQSSRVELSQAFHKDEKSFIFPRQVHGNQIEIIESSIQTEDIPDTDALITNKPGLCICVQTADCVPVLLFDPIKHVAAAIHAGWRGTVNKIVSETVDLLKEKFQINPENLLAGIGPSASPSVYEVGQDVIVHVQQNFLNHHELLSAGCDEGKALLNLWNANKTLLLESGLLEKNIEVMNQCTIKNENHFYSARREGADTGRMVTGIMIQ